MGGICIFGSCSYEYAWIGALVIGNPSSTEQLKMWLIYQIICILWKIKSLPFQRLRKWLLQFHITLLWPLERGHQPDISINCCNCLNVNVLCLCFILRFPASDWGDFLKKCWIFCEKQVTMRKEKGGKENHPDNRGSAARSAGDKRWWKSISEFCILVIASHYPHLCTKVPQLVLKFICELIFQQDVQQEGQRGRRGG